MWLLWGREVAGGALSTAEGPAFKPREASAPVPQQPAPPLKVRGLKPYSLKAERARIKLNQNENPWDLPEAIKLEAQRRINARPWSRYPDFPPKSLRDRLASFAGCDAEGILVGNGSNELIQALLMVTVERDQWGVPHVRASSLEDLVEAQGYVMAQDRLWQMDLLRRVARGQLSEILGSATINVDKQFRTNAYPTMAADGSGRLYMAWTERGLQRRERLRHLLSVQ